ncbi:MAG TPA: hypothetical protein VKB50_28810 [Vicinamibacterales bacterium]|nr:hypothetical protein [Vicinamibacterales bacterium]
MRSIGVIAASIVSILFSFPTVSSAAIVGCSVLTQAQIAAATGAPVGSGSPIAAPTSCQWSGKGKMITLTIRQPLANKSPVDQFNDAKKRTLPGVTIEPVSGVGDDAFYIYYAGHERSGCGLVVKKGSSVFEVRVYGFDLSQGKTVSKTLSQQAVAKF